MSPLYVVLCIFSIYYIGYRFYAGFLSKKIFTLRDDVVTPAHRYYDGVDYVPAKRFLLLGHHYASISGLGPILGPIIAVIWGWLPAMIWVVLGSLFIGATHDFGILVLSMRSKGLSVGGITEYLIGKRAKILALLITYFLVSLAMGVFVLVLAKLLSPDNFPQVVFPSAIIVLFALLVGYTTHIKKWPMYFLGIPACIGILASIYLSRSGVLADLTFHTESAGLNWKLILLGYSFLSSVLPVWLLLQSRDFLNAIFLIAGLFLLYIGFFASDLSFNAPMVQLYPKNAPPLFPFIFVLIACGAISGFHGLVSSGTTAKQINCEKDARLIGYGGMIAESLLGLVAILATTTAFANTDAWSNVYSDFNGLGLSTKVSLFVNGGVNFLHSLGIDSKISTNFIVFLVVSFALTSLDSATRLLRYNIEELSSYITYQPIRKFVSNKHIAALVAIGSIAFFTFFSVQGQSVASLLWTLFGTTNQLLATFSLLLISIYLYSRGRNMLVSFIPMLFLLGAVLYGMSYQLFKFVRQDASWTLIIMTCLLLFFGSWLLIEAILAFYQYKHKKIERLDVMEV